MVRSDACIGVVSDLPDTYPEEGHHSLARYQAFPNTTCSPTAPDCLRPNAVVGEEEAAAGEETAAVELCMTNNHAEVSAASAATFGSGSSCNFEWSAGRLHSNLMTNSLASSCSVLELGPYLSKCLD